VRAALHVELDGARELDDRLRVTAVLEQRVFDRLGAVDEQAAEQAVLFLRDPLAAFVAADEHERSRAAAQRRFDQFHEVVPSGVERRCPPAGVPLRRSILMGRRRNAIRRCA
jgi:hypothetical protein